MRTASYQVSLSDLRQQFTFRTTASKIMTGLQRENRRVIYRSLRHTPQCF